MIKSISGSGFVNVVGNWGNMPYINANSQNPSQGMVRVNGNDMQVFDGNSWVTLSSSYALIELNQEAQGILEWARKKMNDESEIKVLAEKNKSVAIALENLNKAAEQLTITAILAKEHEE
jgi:hypothetical protein